MKKLNLSGKKLLLDKTIIANLDKSKMKKVVGGVDPDEDNGAFLSLISCHTDHNGSACSGCQTCCSGGGCFVAC